MGILWKQKQKKQAKVFVFLLLFFFIYNFVELITKFFFIFVVANKTFSDAFERSVLTITKINKTKMAIIFTLIQLLYFTLDKQPL